MYLSIFFGHFCTHPHCMTVGIAMALLALLWCVYPGGCPLEPILGMQGVLPLQNWGLLLWSYPAIPLKVTVPATISYMYFIFLVEIKFNWLRSCVDFFRGRKKLFFNWKVLHTYICTHACAQAEQCTYGGLCYGFYFCAEVNTKSSSGRKMMI